MSDFLKYAIFGDIHSAKEDLNAVLAAIQNKAPEAKCIATGDLFECTVSKKDITAQKFTSLDEVMLNPEGFSNLFTFPSVSGNQEDRILLITETNDPLREKIRMLPETIEIEGAEIIHGHQWKWGGNPWALIEADVRKSLFFYGHSHTSILKRNGMLVEIEFGVAYDVSGENVLVNVGSVIGNKEWVLYDSEEGTVSFMKA